ncbi:FliH/SctL family protein [Desulfovibrio intestinalis]|uniref:Flagellar assembly protein FliH n=1 Tax=Desulfovibrio intestinalis TaxID=58621 RepID=A0A7W8FGK6_9BACT|nr:FliH/SctL family protein [Desulfovibrio intestinalis]MBB5142907.1 flagellar biosynthesis/type III secretory pathway protein FliH [Desulfovibrio intestinalis]
MASDQLRKKWGTVFMGEREATVEQLDAMQEPLRRERMQQQQQEDYFVRVRAKAEERAREILGAAYAERQKVLDEAKVEAHELSRRLTHESETVRAQAQEEMKKAQAELDQALALKQEAQALRDGGHAEGFQAGMDQAGQELKEFRAEMGQALGAVLYALDSQRHSICESWRDELVLLMQEAVKAGTGWVLDEEHKNIMQSLVFEALNLLEDRATVTVRVHPDDEATVSDMFMAARERVPELQQWIVSGDASVERGGLLAESISGSVDCRREHYTELVNGIMSHLSLGSGQDDEQNSEALSQLVHQEAERIAAMAPAPEQPSPSDDLASPDDLTSPVDQPGAADHAEQLSTADSADPLNVNLPSEQPDEYSDMQPDQQFHATEELALEEDHQQPVPDAEALMVEEPELSSLASGTQPSSDMPSEVFAQNPSAHDSAHDSAGDVSDSAANAHSVADHMQPEHIPAEQTSAEQISAEHLDPQRNSDAEHPSAPAAATSAEIPAGPEHGADASGMPGHAANPAADVSPAQAETRGAAVPAPRSAVQVESPTLAELEDELFPLDAEDGLGLPEQSSSQDFDPSALADLIGHAEQGDHDSQDVFSQGGFLPGAEKGR